jgi:hypothetical protein
LLIPLVVLGVVLIAFGAVVLLRYADRPGGTIKWMGAEVTSKGAGLPLIALGVMMIGFAVVRFPLDGRVPEPNGNSAAVPGDSTCMAEWLSEVQRDRVRSIEVGMRDVQIIGPHQQLDLPFVLLLTENGQRIGAIRLRLYRGTDYGSDLYKVEDAIDARCTKVEELQNPSRGGNPRELVNFDTLRVTLGGQPYEIRIGGEGSIGVGHFTRVQA